MDVRALLVPHDEKGHKHLRPTTLPAFSDRGPPGPPAEAAAVPEATRTTVSLGRVIDAWKGMSDVPPREEDGVEDDDGAPDDSVEDDDVVGGDDVHIGEAGVSFEERLQSNTGPRDRPYYLLYIAAAILIIIIVYSFLGGGKKGGEGAGAGAGETGGPSFASDLAEMQFPDISPLV